MDTMTKMEELGIRDSVIMGKDYSKEEASFDSD
jgi:hypothetical protein